MTIEYPIRPAIRPWVRNLCMVFGIANVLGGVASIAYYDDWAFSLPAGILVGGTWLAFGKLGGFPLFDTVPDWNPPTNLEVVSEMHRRGLLVMRRRMRTIWLSFLAVLGTAPLT